MQCGFLSTDTRLYKFCVNFFIRLEIFVIILTFLLLKHLDHTRQIFFVTSKTQNKSSLDNQIILITIINATCHDSTQFWPHLRPHQQQLNIINQCKKNQKYHVLIYSKQCTLFIMSNVTWHICPWFVQRFVKTWGRIGDQVALGGDRLFPNRIPRARRSLANFQKGRTKIIA